MSDRLCCVILHVQDATWSVLRVLGLDLYVFGLRNDFMVPLNSSRISS